MASRVNKSGSFNNSFSNSFNDSSSRSKNEFATLFIHNGIKNQDKSCSFLELPSGTLEKSSSMEVMKNNNSFKKEDYSQLFQSSSLKGHYSFRKSNELEELSWFYPNTSSSTAEAVLAQYNINGAYILVKEKREREEKYDYYDMCVWNANAPVHFRVSYCKSTKIIEFGSKKFNIHTFIQQFNSPTYIVLSDNDNVVIREPIPFELNEPPCLFDRIHFQDITIIKDEPTISLQKSKSEENLLSEPTLSKGGYLIKRGHLIKNWKKRWFTLNKSILSYHTVKPEIKSNSKLKGIINLKDVEEFDPEDHSVRQKYCFSITLQSSGVKYLMYTITEEDYKAWIKVLQRAISQYRDTKRYHDNLFL